MWEKRASWCWLLFGPVLAAGAQVQIAADFQESAGVPAYRATAREVRLVVTASDPQGAPAFLLPGDLQISEDGRPVSALTGFYRTAGQPLDVALLVDASTSVDKQLAAEVRAVRAFLERALGPGDRARVVPFAEQVEVVEAPAGDTRRLEPALAKARGHGAVTRLFDAIVLAAEGFGPGDGHARRVMVVLSDGEDTDSAADLVSALEAARKAGAALYTVGVGDEERGREVLRALAELSGGLYFDSHAAKELERILAQIGRESVAQYVVTFRAEAAPDGKFHALRATTTRPGVRLRTRTGYFAMKCPPLRWNVPVAGGGGFLRYCCGPRIAHPECRRTH